MDKELILPVRAAGITFKNPFYVSSGPTTRTVEQLLAIERAGWAAAVLKLAIDPAPYINRRPRYALFPEYDALGFTAEKRLTFAQGLEVVRDAKKKLTDLVLMVNITYAGEGDERGWVNMAERFCEAGADAIELNMCCPNMSFNVETTGGAREGMKRTGASAGMHADLVTPVVRAVKAAVDKPLLVKLCGEGGVIGPVARAVTLAGADGVGSSGNRLGMPPIDLENPAKAIYHLQEEISMTCYAGGWLKPLAQRDTYEMRKAAGPDVAIFATGAIRTAEDAIQMAMCGGDMAGICTETLLRGYDFVGDLVRDTKRWLEEHGKKSYRDVRDEVVCAVRDAADLTIYEGGPRLKQPGLTAPCQAACKRNVPVQAVLRAAAKKDFARAAELAASAACETCDAPCEKACAMGRLGQSLSVRNVICFVRARAGLTDCAQPRPVPEDRAVSRASDVLSRRKVDLLARRHAAVADEETVAAEAARCLRCGCGEGCQRCREACCEFAISLDDQGRVAFDAAKCVACGMCMNVCPNRNIEMVSSGEILP